VPSRGCFVGRRRRPSTTDIASPATGNSVTVTSRNTRGAAIPMHSAAVHNVSTPIHGGAIPQYGRAQYPP
jgi:hypothetical protein